LDEADAWLQWFSPAKSVRLIWSICGRLYRVNVTVSPARPLSAQYRGPWAGFTGYRCGLGLEVLGPVGAGWLYPTGRTNGTRRRGSRPAAWGPVQPGMRVMSRGPALAMSCGGHRCAEVKPHPSRRPGREWVAAKPVPMLPGAVAQHWAGPTRVSQDGLGSGRGLVWPSESESNLGRRTVFPRRGRAVGRAGAGARSPTQHARASGITLEPGFLGPDRVCTWASTAVLHEARSCTWTGPPPRLPAGGPGDWVSPTRSRRPLFPAMSVLGDGAACGAMDRKASESAYLAENRQLTLRVGEPGCTAGAWPGAGQPASESN
jgi:hypothetical protein